MRGASEAPGTTTRTNFGTMEARAPNGGRLYSNKVSGTAALVPAAFPGPTGPDSMKEDRPRNPERMAHNKVADLHRYGSAHPGRRQCGSVAMAHPIPTRPKLLDCNLQLSRGTAPLAYWTVLHSYARGSASEPLSTQYPTTCARRMSGAQTRIKHPTRCRIADSLAEPRAQIVEESMGLTGRFDRGLDSRVGVSCRNRGSGPSGLHLTGPARHGPTPVASLLPTSLRCAGGKLACFGEPRVLPPGFLPGGTPQVVRHYTSGRQNSLPTPVRSLTRTALMESVPLPGAHRADPSVRPAQTILLARPCHLSVARGHHLRKGLGLGGRSAPRCAPAVREAAVAVTAPNPWAQPDSPAPAHSRQVTLYLPWPPRRQPTPVHRPPDRQPPLRKPTSPRG